MYDEGSNLSLLAGCPHILKTIWLHINDHWREVVELPVVAYPDYDDVRNVGGIDTGEILPSCLYLTPVSSSDPVDYEIAEYSFPPPTDININMMPFIVGETFTQCKLPEFVRPYWSMIEACLNPELNRHRSHIWPTHLYPSEVGKVNYLTIQEGWVEAGASQRRPGLHVDSPGEVRLRGEENEPGDKGRGSSQPYKGHHWGEGCAHSVPIQGTSDLSYVLRGGIYLSSSLQSSCRAWNCSVGHKAVGM